MKLRWAMCAMGAWLAGGVITSIVATQNFHTVDRLLTSSTNPAFSTLVDQLGRPHAREFLRYLSSELNRLYFQLWNVAQLAIGLVVLWLLAREPGAARARRGVVVMLLVVVVMLAWMTPEITSMGRSLDFVPRDPPPPVMRRFWIFHAAYTLLAVGNLLLGAIVAVWIQRTRPEAARSATQ